MEEKEVIKLLELLSKVTCCIIDKEENDILNIMYKGLNNVSDDIRNSFVRCIVDIKRHNSRSRMKK